MTASHRQLPRSGRLSAASPGRLNELGFGKSSPQRFIAEGTDWRFLDELKRELKA